MISGSWQLALSGWVAIVAGSIMALFGLLYIGILFSGRAIPVGAGRIIAILALGAGPLLFVSGIAMILSGVKLMNGFSWARMVIQAFSWIALVGSVAWLAYSASEKSEIDSYVLVRGAIFFLVTGAPASVLILLLRMNVIQSAMKK
jgi:hypothetical protein